MKEMKLMLAAVLATLLAAAVCPNAFAEVLFEKTTPYHHILVVDEGGIRTLHFDDGEETQMSLQDPLKGHFEYTEYLQMPWLWNTQIVNVLMIGLGGGSTQRSFVHYHPEVTVDTVEIDPVVLQVATNYFTFKESPKQKVHIEDGRMFLRRSTAKYDLIILDAYVQGRYGACIPQHLATQEFFELVRDHLTTNGVAAYNVIGTLYGWQATIVGAIYRTLNTVFPQVYIFPANTSQNVVLIATKDKVKANLSVLRERAYFLVQNRQATLPTFRDRVGSFMAQAPPSVARSPLLTDDYAPVEGLMETGTGLDASRRASTNAPAGRPPQ